MQNSYRIKTIQFMGKPCRILMQSENGPCPLLAILNIFYLRQLESIHSDVKFLDYESAIQILTNRILDKQNFSGTEQQVQDVLTIIPKLNRGLDVNVKFKQIDQFEYTKELDIFDLVEIRLLHGWVVNPQDKQAFNLISNLNYNKLVENLLDNSEKSKIMQK